MGLFNFFKKQPKVQVPSQDAQAGTVMGGQVPAQAPTTNVPDPSTTADLGAASVQQAATVTPIMDVASPAQAPSPADISAMAEPASQMQQEIKAEVAQEMQPVKEEPVAASETEAPAGPSQTRPPATPAA